MRLRLGCSAPMRALALALAVLVAAPVPAGAQQSPLATQQSLRQSQANDFWALVPPDIRAQLGNDSCVWANDLECDDPQFGGTGACAPGTDASDCRAMAMGGDNSCQWALDGTCHEVGIGTGLCASGTDSHDCADVAFLRNRTNSCARAFDGVCDEPGIGTGLCAANTDTADCVGRARPAQMRDHFFGHDDRELVDVSVMPWRAIGLVELSGGTCTGALIGPRHVATSAHCLLDGAGGRIKALTFRAGASGAVDSGHAGISAYLIAPDYQSGDMPPHGGNGNDWAILTLDRPLGADVGYLAPLLLDKPALDAIASGDFRVSQAGYSWDTGDRLSGHRDCRVLAAYNDGSLIHDCDSTRGDSGSPLITRHDGAWRLVALDSRFWRPQPPYEDFASSHLAVDTRAFAGGLRQLGLID